MGFSAKIKQFFKDQNLTQRQVSERMGGYSEVMISRAINSDEISAAFLVNLLKYFPEIDYNWLLLDDPRKQVSEPPARYSVDSHILIKEIQERLKLLDENLSPK